MGLRKRALAWWSLLPNYGESKDYTFDQLRFETKGGLRNIYHPDKFIIDLTDDEIIKIFNKHANKYINLQAELDSIKCTTMRKVLEKDMSWKYLDEQVKNRFHVIQVALHRQIQKI